MSALKSISLAIELSVIKRDQALAQLQKTVQAHAFAQDQQQQLQQYADETDARWTRSGQAGTTPELMQHHYQFMGRLTQAIALQDGVLSGTTQRVEAAKQLLLQAEFRLASLKQVLASRQADLAKSQQRREQKQMDEFAALQTQRHKRIQAENNV